MCGQQIASRNDAYDLERFSTRDDGKSTVDATAPVRTTPTPAPSQPRSVKPEEPKRPVVEKPPASAAPPTPDSSPPVDVAPPPPPVVPQEPPETTPAVSPPSVLRWSATPAALAIPAGGHKTLTVHVVNPSEGTVTLGHPLSCAPTLHDAKGHAIGYGVCVEMAQLMAPHDALMFVPVGSALITTTPSSRMVTASSSG